MKTLRQRVKIKASPQAIYDTLLTSSKHARLIGSSAKVSKKVGAKFSAFKGWIQGKNLELTPGKKIVQAWRGKDWPKGVYSRASFTLKKIKGGTQINFYHSGIPSKFCKDITKGWHEYYWKPMKRMWG